jgi:hypothetical protein
MVSVSPLLFRFDGINRVGYIPSDFKRTITYFESEKKESTFA